MTAGTKQPVNSTDPFGCPGGRRRCSSIWSSLSFADRCKAPGGGRSDEHGYEVRILTAGVVACRLPTIPHRQKVQG
jgi:hypothetical protein